MSLTWLQATGWTEGVLYEPFSNNQGINNRYWYPSPEGALERFRWKTPPLISKLSDFNATTGEEGGRYLTESEKAEVIAAKEVPANPEPR